MVYRKRKPREQIEEGNERSKSKVEHIVKMAGNRYHVGGHLIESLCISPLILKIKDGGNAHRL